MVTLNHRLTALVVALIASFAVVLAVGAFGGGSPSPSASHRAELTISVVPEAVSSAPASSGKSSQFGGSQVWMLRIGSLAIAASGYLKSAGKPVTTVPTGSDLVCVSPPGGWRHVSPADTSGPALICSRMKVGIDSATASGSLNSAGKLVTNVPSGSYLVCVNPPAGWQSVTTVIVALPGWICQYGSVHTGRQTLEIPLTNHLPIRDGGGQ